METFTASPDGRWLAFVGSEGARLPDDRFALNTRFKTSRICLFAVECARMFKRFRTLVPFRENVTWKLAQSYVCVCTVQRSTR